MKKLVILELDVTTIKETFTAYSAGIYQKTLSVSDAIQAPSPLVTILGGTWTIGSTPLSVGSVRVDDNLLGSVGSISELYDQDGSFFFSEATQTIYIALFDYYPAYGYRSYKVGETSGFISEAQNQLINGRKYPVSSRIGATYYKPRLIGDVDIPESVDDQSNSIFIYDEIQATLDNGDGDLDNIREDVTGNEARVLIAHISESKEEEIETGFPFKIRASADDFHIVREGIVEDLDYSNPSRPVVTAIDPRADWTQKISTELMTTAEYPDLEDKYIDKRKPLLIGQVNGTPCIRLAPKPSTSTDTDFLVCDTSVGDINTVDSIYFDGKISGSEVDRELLVSEYSIDLTTGILTINNYDTGDAYFYGSVTDLNETVEIVLFLLDKYAGISYIASNFNQIEVEAIRNLNFTTHVYSDKSGEKLRDVIETLISDVQVDFFQQGSVLTMRKSNEERTPTEEVQYWEISDNPAPWVDDRTDTVKTISIGYNRDYRQDTFDTYYDDSNEETAIDNNRKAVDKVIETNLTNRDDVSEIYDEYYNRFVVASRAITINRLRPFTAQLTDFVYHTIQRVTPDGSKQIFERATYQIVEIDQNSNTATAVYFSDAPEAVSGSSDYGIANYGVENYG